MELVNIVNEKDEPIGVASASEVHQKGLIHREACVYLINNQGKVVLQQRRNNSLWDHSAAGHFSHTETYLEGAKRELKEELGVEVEESELREIGYERLGSVKGPRQQNFRFMKIYVVYKDIGEKDLVLNSDEVLQVKFFNKEELKKILQKPQILTQSGKKLIEKYIIELL